MALHIPALCNSVSHREAEHVSEAAAAEFPLTAQTYLCDSRSPLPDLLLPLQLIFFRPAPPHQIFGPLPVQCFKEQTEETGPIFAMRAAMLTRY